MPGRNDAIATGSVVLSTNSDKAMSGLTQFKSKMSSAMADLNKRFSGSGGLSGMLAPPGAMAGLAATAGGVLSIGSAISEINDIAKMSNVAKALGADEQAFSGIMGLIESVGGNTREAIESFVTLNKVADDAVKGNGEVAAEFFKDLNIGAKEFRALRPDQQFFRFYEALALVEDQQKKGRLTAIAFGEDGMKNVIELVNRTPEALKAQAKAHEIVMEKQEKAKRAALAFAEAQMKMKTLWRDIVIAAAPVFEFLATELTRAADGFTKFGDVGSSSMERLIRLSAKFAEVTKASTAIALMAGGARLKLLEAEVALGAAKSVASIPYVGPALAAAAFSGTLLLIEESEIGKTMRAAGGSMLELGQQLWADRGKTEAAAEKFIANMHKRDAEMGKGKGGMGGWFGNVEWPKPPEVYRAPSKFAEAIMQGSKEAYSLEMKYNFGLGQKQDIPKQQLAEQKRTNKILEQKLGKEPALKVKVI